MRKMTSFLAGTLLLSLGCIAGENHLAQRIRAASSFENANSPAESTLEEQMRDLIDQELPAIVEEVRENLSRETGSFIPDYGVPEWDFKQHPKEFVTGSYAVAAEPDSINGRPTVFLDVDLLEMYDVIPPTCMGNHDVDVEKIFRVSGIYSTLRHEVGHFFTDMIGLDLNGEGVAGHKDACGGMLSVHSIDGCIWSAFMAEGIAEYIESGKSPTRFEHMEDSWPTREQFLDIQSNALRPAGHAFVTSLVERAPAKLLDRIAWDTSGPSGAVFHAANYRDLADFLVRAETNETPPYFGDLGARKNFVDVIDSSGTRRTFVPSLNGTNEYCQTSITGGDYSSVSFRGGSWENNQVYRQIDCN